MGGFSPEYTMGPPYFTEGAQDSLGLSAKIGLSRTKQATRQYDIIDDRIALQRNKQKIGSSNISSRNTLKKKLSIESESLRAKIVSIFSRLVLLSCNSNQYLLFLQAPKIQKKKFHVKHKLHMVFTPTLLYFSRFLNACRFMA